MKNMKSAGAPLGQKSRTEIVTLVVVAGVGLAAVTLLPSELLPQCPIHAITGYLCPGCGTQRAARALLAGDLESAWKLNQLVFFVPSLAGLGILAERRKSSWLKIATISLSAMAAVVFTVWRNLG